MKKALLSLLLTFYTVFAFADNLTDSNKLFDWAEQNYPELFSPAGAANQTLDAYLFRYYSNTNFYLATSGNNVYYYAPDQSADIVSVGVISDYISISDTDSPSTSDNSTQSSLLDIQFNYTGQISTGSSTRSWTDADKALFNEALQKWQTIIKGIKGYGEKFTIAVDVSVEKNLNGDGAAGWVSSKQVGSNYFATKATLQIHADKYAASRENNATNKAEDFNNIFHEIGHILGIGNGWFDDGDGNLGGRNWITRSDEADGYVYKQPQAMAKYNEIFSTSFDFLPIGVSTAHPYGNPEDKAKRIYSVTGVTIPAMVNEVMANGKIISAVTIGFLDDLGWDVDYSKAENYPVPTDITNTSASSE